MTNLMETLYTYAQSHGIAAFLSQDADYERSVQCAQVQEDKLRAALNSDETVRLEALLDEHNLQLFILERAAFTAGYRLALELTR